ncbi:MAG: flagellar protein FlaG [Gammaproteobacteria bacterium]|jgi:flagellar protein FlaG
MESKFISMKSRPPQLTTTQLVDEARSHRRAQAPLENEAAEKPHEDSPISNAEVPATVRIPLSDIALEELVSYSNQQIQATTRELHFSIDKKYGRPIVTVVDKETGKVVRQIPSDVAMQVADTLDDGTGVLVSERA